MVYRDFETNEVVAAHTPYGWFPAIFFCLIDQPGNNVEHKYFCRGVKGGDLVVDLCEPFDDHFKRDEHGRIFEVQ